MPIDHIGLNVPDVPAALAYYDELFAMVGYVREWETGYRPHDWYGAQLFLYPALDDRQHSRLATGFSHLAFYVHTRDEVRRVHDWAMAKGHEVLHEPRPFPEYGEHCFATHFIDVHELHIEVSTHVDPSA